MPYNIVPVILPRVDNLLRAAVVLVFCCLLAGCTSMLLGGTSSGENTASSGGQASQSPVSAQDRQISAAIRGAFSTDRELGRFAIGIRTAGRVVTLSGTVTSFSLRDRAVAIAGDAAGVTEVRNRIVVNSNAN